MSGVTNGSPAQPAVVLGLTFLLIGLSFAIPLHLVPTPSAKATSDLLSPETANVYACVAWAGWAHFLYSFRGQGIALLRSDLNGRAMLFSGVIVVTVIVLTSLRWLFGPAIFSAAIWVYFIDHFVKAERFFVGRPLANESIFVRWWLNYQPLVAFGWLTVILLDVGGIDSHRWLVWIVSLVLAAIVLLNHGWKKLVSGDSRSPLLSLFFIAEALVWGAFSSYGGAMFLTGVYIFHIAAGSYFHYLGCYFAAQARAKGGDRWLEPVVILAINVGIGLIGFLVMRFQALTFLNPIFGIEWFTLWVGVHLVGSDLFPIIKPRINPRVGS